MPGTSDQRFEPASPFKEPPKTLEGILLQIGPGLILVGNIVGSGELIATPRLSAEAGYYFLWLILFSCVIKVFFQLEIGRYAVSEGRTTLESLNDLPGPKLAGLNWILWYWLLMNVAVLFQVGGMVGGVGQALDLAMPFDIHWNIGAWTLESVHVWTILTGLSGILLLMRGRYRMIENVSVLLVTMFTVVTMYTVGHLQFTDKALTASDLATGFSFRLPPDAEVATILGGALMAFGITGVGATELVAYPYWCLEKGYGKYIGRREESADWVARTRGWLRVMWFDCWIGCLIFTIATVAFYILGAECLYPTPPPEKTMVVTLSKMYSTTFGPFARWIFLVGAFSVLYSTFFVSTASNARMLVDWAGLAGWIDRSNPQSRQRGITVLCIVQPIVYTALYLFFQAPQAMVATSGIMQALMLPMLGFAVLYFAYYRTDRRIRGGRLWYAALWLAFLCMTTASLYMAGRSAMTWLSTKSI